MSDQPEFAAFVGTQTPSLLRSAYLLTGDRAAAEDLVQDTFLRLYPRWDRVQASDIPLAYVRRSLTNNFINSRRGKNNALSRELPLAELPETAGPDFANQVNDAGMVRALLEALPPRPRAVLVLRFYHDLTDEQIAADLGIRVGTVRSIVSRALTSLRLASTRQERSASAGDPSRTRPVIGTNPAAHKKGTAS